MHATAFAPTHPRTVLPGLVLAAAIAVLALLLGRCLPLIGGPVFGLVLGLLVRSVLAPDARFVPGITFASTTVLQASIIALGFGL
ncbi:MAG TPA: putative sulfate exporter family transporter, partial [Rhodanobacter sp.]|nr:putative sulfate exporter family transporter [Rhodanobacter sp.]